MGESIGTEAGGDLIDKKKQFPGTETASQKRERESSQRSLTADAASKLSGAGDTGSRASGTGEAAEAAAQRTAPRTATPQIDSRAAVREQRAAAETRADTSPEGAAGRRRRRLEAGRPRRSAVRIKKKSESGTNVSEPEVQGGISIPR